MARVLPEWQPFDQDLEDLTPLELSGRRGPALVLLASPSLDASEWAGRLAIRLASQRADLNGRLLLADLALDRPRLHTLLDTPNDEGMSDALLFGASVQRIARRVDGGFLFAPAGTAVADSRSVLASERWEPLIEGFERAGADLFLYVPWDTDGWEELLEKAKNVVVLAGRHEVAALDLPDTSELRIGAVLGPPDRASEPEAEVVGSEGAGLHGLASAGPPEDVVEIEGTEERAGVAAPGEDVEGGTIEGGTEEAFVRGAEVPEQHPPEPEFEPAPREATGGRTEAFRGPSSRSTPHSDGSRLTLWLIIAAIVVILLILVARGFVQMQSPRTTSEDPREQVSEPNVSPGQAAPEGEADEEQGPDAAEEFATPSPPLLEWTVGVASYRNRNAAVEAAAELGERFPETLFPVVPVDVEGATWYRVLGGPSATMDDATTLREAIARARGVDPGSMLLRTTPFAVLVASFEELGEARARIRALGDEGIPAYALQAPPDTDGTYTVYVGAFESVDEASAARGLLIRAGHADPAVVRRTGVVPIS